MTDAGVPDEIGFQERFWRIERVAWAAMALIVAAAVMGAFGNGPLANVELRVGDIAIHYERIQRAGRESRIVFVRQGPEVRQGIEPVAVVISGPALRNADLVDHAAMPPLLEASQEQLTFDASGSTVLRLTMRGMGWYAATIRVADAPARDIRILVLP